MTRRRFHRRGKGAGRWLALAAALAGGCGKAEDPPGRSIEALAAVGPILPAPEPRRATEGAEEGSRTKSRADTEPGRGAKIASIAMRTWIYVAPSDRSTKLG